MKQRQIIVKTVRLDDQVDTADMVKIDVEGAEVSVLRSAERLLTEASPHLLVEIEARHSTNPAASFEMLQGFGYEGFFLDPDSAELRALPIVCFDFDRHQQRALQKEPGAPRSSLYVNNFLFTHCTKLHQVQLNLASRSISLPTVDAS